MLSSSRFSLRSSFQLSNESCNFGCVIREGDWQPLDSKTSFASIVVEFLHTHCRTFINYKKEADFRWICSPFERIGRPFERFWSPFERFWYPFERFWSPFERFGSPFERFWSPFEWVLESVRTVPPIRSNCFPNRSRLMSNRLNGFGNRLNGLPSRLLSVCNPFFCPFKRKSVKVRFPRAGHIF